MRVIAGLLSGRRLQTPRGLDTRPTSERVRESLFMALEPLAGLRVVDLFAGSGALGIEALSRGAVHVDFVEAARAARVMIEANLTALGLEGCARVWPFRLPAGLDRLAAPLARADLVLLDPPYGGALALGTLERLGRRGALSPQTRVAVEHHAKDGMPERVGALALAGARRYGETVVSLYGCEPGEA